MAPLPVRVGNCWKIYRAGQPCCLMSFQIASRVFQDSVVNFVNIVNIFKMFNIVNRLPHEFFKTVLSTLLTMSICQNVQNCQHVHRFWNLKIFIGVVNILLIVNIANICHCYQELVNKINKFQHLTDGECKKYIDYCKSLLRLG